MTSSPDTKKCVQCGKEFRVVLVWATYCSGDCERKHYDKMAGAHKRSADKRVLRSR